MLAHVLCKKREYFVRTAFGVDFHRRLCYNFGVKYYAYLLKCADGSIYAGFTTDPEKRAAAHNAGKGAKYTRSRLPVTLAYCEEFLTEHEARSREWHLKRLSHAEKIALISQYGERIINFRAGGDG